MKKLLKALAKGIAFIYSGIIVAISVVTGLMALASVIAVFAGISAVIQ